MSAEPSGDDRFPPFPPPGRSPSPRPPRIRDGVLALRPALDADLPFLRALFGALRADEMALAPWPDAVKQTFLDEQFRLQHHHFVTHSPSGDFLIVERDGQAVGRLYLDRGEAGWRVIDIGLLPEHRGRGIGAALLAWIQAWARRAGAPLVDLHVVRPNAGARRLYQRLGFRLAEPDDHPTHLRMVWRPGRQAP